MSALPIDPKPAVADGAPRFWKALPQAYPTARGQRCWVHKTANVKDWMHKRGQPKPRSMRHAIWMAPTRVHGHKAFDAFTEMFEAKDPLAVECRKKHGTCG